MLLPCLVIAIVSLAGGREARAGVLFAVLTVIKPPFLLFLPYLVLRRRTTAAVAFAATLTLIVTTSMALFGTELHRLWLATFIGPFAARPVAAYNVQSISGLVAHFTMPGHLTDWTPLEAPAMFNAARYVLLLAVTAIAAIALFARGAPRDAAAHQLELYCVLVLHAARQPAHLESLLRVRRPGVGRLCCGAHTCPRRLADDRGAGGDARVPPVVLPLLSAPMPAALVERVLISHYTWGGILLLGCLCASRLAAARGQGTSARDASSRESAASLILSPGEAHVSGRSRDPELLAGSPPVHTGAITPDLQHLVRVVPRDLAEIRPAWSSAAEPSAFRAPRTSLPVSLPRDCSPG